MAQATGAGLAPLSLTAYPQAIARSYSSYGPHGGRPQRPWPRPFNGDSPFLMLPLEIRYMIYEYCAASDSDLPPPTFRHSRSPFGQDRRHPARTYAHSLHNLLATGPICEEVLSAVPRYLPLAVRLGSLEADELDDDTSTWEKRVISEHREIRLHIYPYPARGIRRNLWAFCDYFDEVQQMANPLKILRICVGDFLRWSQDHGNPALMEDLEEWIDSLSDEVMMKTWLDCGQSVDRVINARLGAPFGVSRAQKRIVDAIIRMKRHWS